MKRVRDKSHSWITKDIRKLMNKRDIIHRTFLKLKRKQHMLNYEESQLCLKMWKDYKKVRNKVSILLEKKKEIILCLKLKKTVMIQNECGLV